jgi:hypothetical protein
MPGFQILNARSAPQRDDWLALWSSWPDREVFAHPAYVELFTEPCDTPLCAVLDSPEGGVLFPLILRPLAAAPWAEPCCNGCDLTTPYGYGGPFAWGKTEPDRFWCAFTSWTSEQHIVSLFARLSLFAEQMIPFAGDVEENRPNLVRTLELRPDELWMDYEHKVRKNVNRARRSGLEVEVDLTGRRLAESIEIYKSTLARREASRQYNFPQAFFRRIKDGLAGQVAFFHALHEGRVVSTELILVSASHVYSFLGGTLEEAFELRPNDLLKHAIIEWCMQKGMKAYVLGGGYEPHDGIFRYKKSFAPNGEVPFRTGKRVFDAGAYQKLVDMRRQWESKSGDPWTPRPGFFPTYRG